jgi:hypothetical protein
MLSAFTSTGPIPSTRVRPRSRSGSRSGARSGARVRSRRPGSTGWQRAVLGAVVLTALLASVVYIWHIGGMCSSTPAEAEGVRAWYHAWLRTHAPSEIRSGGCKKGILGEFGALFSNDTCERTLSGHMDTNEARRAWCDLPDVARARFTRPTGATDAAVACQCGTWSRVLQKGALYGAPEASLPGLP